MSAAPFLRTQCPDGTHVPSKRYQGTAHSRPNNLRGEHAWHRSTGYPDPAPRRRHSELAAQPQLGLWPLWHPRHLADRGAGSGVDWPRLIRPEASTQAAIVSFTAATSCLSVNGLARKLNLTSSGRFFSNASSA